MTTDARRSAAPAVAFRWIFTPIAIFLGWLVIASGAGLLGRYDTHLVLLSRSDFIANLPDGVGVVGTVGMLPVVKSSSPPDVARLFKAGALVVIPARAKTCLDLSGANRTISLGTDKGDPVTGAANGVRSPMWEFSATATATGTEIPAETRVGRIAL